MKRFISLFFLLIMLVSIALLPASAATNIIFTMINDRFLDLRDSTMPLFKSGRFYLPYADFTGELGLKSTYVEAEKVLVLYNWDHILTFNMMHNYAYDEDMNSFKETAISHNGTIYVPAQFVAEQLGLTYSTLSLSSGMIVRVRNSISRLDDSLVSYISPPVMSDLLGEYQRRSPSDNNPVSPVTPTERKTVYLTIKGSLNGNTVKILNSLQQYDYDATFFLSGESIQKNDNLLRRLYAEGHSIGILNYSLSGPSLYLKEDTLLSELSRTNELIQKTTKLRSRLIQVPAGTDLASEMRDRLVREGYRIWGATISIADTVKNPTSSQISSKTISALSKTSKSVVLSLDSTAETASALPKILEYLKKNNYYVFKINEWDAPINSFNDIR